MSKDLCDSVTLQIGNESDQEKSDKEKNNTKTSHIVGPLISFGLELLGLADLFGDYLVLSALIRSGEIAWSTLTILMLLTPYIISYPPLMGLFVERSTFNREKTGWGMKIFGFTFLFPISLLYMFLLDLIYGLLGLINTILQTSLFFINKIARKNWKMNNADHWLEHYILKKLCLESTDIQGLRSMRTIAQLLFESIPQIILQARILYVINSGYETSLEISLGEIYFSLLFAGLHLIFEGFLLYLETLVTKSNFFEYCANSMNGMLNWVPFLDKIKNQQQEKKKEQKQGPDYDFGDISSLKL